MDECYLSILLANYNQVDILENRVRSILNALEPIEETWELIIVDDLSSDGSQDLIRELQMLDSRIRIFFNENNLGAVGILNYQLMLAKGKYCQFCACDDLTFDSFYKEAIPAMKQAPELGVCFSQHAIYRQADGVIVHRKIASREDRFYFTPDRFATEMGRCHLRVHTNAAIFKRKDAIELGGIPETLGFLCDGALMHRIALKYGAIYIPKVTAAWRLDEKETFSVRSANDPALRLSLYKKYLTYFLDTGEARSIFLVHKSAILGSILKGLGLTYLLRPKYFLSILSAASWRIYRFFSHRWGSPIEDFLSEDEEFFVPDWVQ